MTTKDFLLSNWPVHPFAVVLAVAIVAGLVLQRERGRPVQGRALLYLSLGIALLLLVLDSPLEVLAEGYLFSAHMLQHLLLLLVVPALLLSAFDPGSGRAKAVEDPRGNGLHLRWLKRVGSHPVVTWLAGTGAMWFWHVPTLCNATTTNTTIRGVQTVSLLGLGTLFWLPIIGPRPERRLPALGGVLYLFTACVGCTLLGIVLTFAPVSVCSIYQHPIDKLGVLPLMRTQWGLTPAVDQQLGGLVMWVPACLIYLCGIMALLARWYAAPVGASTGRSPAIHPSRA